MTRIVGLNGSARPGGKTGRLLKDFLLQCEGMGAQTHLIQVGALMQEEGAPFCRACMETCNGHCLRGTKLEKAYEALAAADGVLIGTPVYYSGVSAQLKAFFDKSRFYRRQNAFVDIAGGVLVTGGAAFGGQGQTVQMLHSMMLVHGMLLLGDGHREVDPGHHALYGGPGALEDMALKRRSDIMARRMVELCSKINRSSAATEWEEPA